MTIDEALDYVDEINATVTWTEEQSKDADFFNSVEKMLEELKKLRLGVSYLNERAYQQGRADAIDEFAEWLDKFHNYGACAIRLYIEEYKELKENKNG